MFWVHLPSAVCGLDLRPRTFMSYCIGIVHSFHVITVKNETFHAALFVAVSWIFFGGQFARIERNWGEGPFAAKAEQTDGTGAPGAILGKFLAGFHAIIFINFQPSDLLILIFEGLKSYCWNVLACVGKAWQSTTCEIKLGFGMISLALTSRASQLIEAMMKKTQCHCARSNVLKWQDTQWLLEDLEAGVSACCQLTSLCRLSIWFCWQNHSLRRSSVAKADWGFERKPRVIGEAQPEEGIEGYHWSRRGHEFVYLMHFPSRQVTVVGFKACFHKNWAGVCQKYRPEGLLCRQWGW